MTRVTALAVRGEERELALSEVQAVLAAVPAGDTRARLDAINAALEDGEPVDAENAGELERLVTLALQSGRARALIIQGYAVEVETSGVLPPPDVLGAVQWNVSVTLAASGVLEARRINPAAIAAFRERGAWWKLVVTEPGEVGEVLRLAERFALPRERVLLQPEGLRAEELTARSPWIVEACKTHGFRFSPRLHVMIWGARRGI